jgi:RNA polymerase sigma factor for flagellar operon FliA
MGNVNSFYQAKQELEQEMKREVTDKEIMKKMGITSSQLGDIYDSIQYLSSVSLESTLYSNNDETVMVQDTLRDSKAPSGEKELMKQERRKELVEAIKRLSEREQLVLSLYYEEDATLKEIAAILDVSIARVSQIHGRAIAKIRGYIEEANQE